MADLQGQTHSRNLTSKLATLRRYLLGSSIQPTTPAGKRVYAEDGQTAPDLGTAEFPWLTLHALSVSVSGTVLDLSTLQSGASADAIRAQTPFFYTTRGTQFWPQNAPASAIIISLPTAAPATPWPNTLSLTGRKATTTNGGQTFAAAASATAAITRQSGFTPGQQVRLNNISTAFVLPEYGA